MSCFIRGKSGIVESQAGEEKVVDNRDMGSVLGVQDNSIFNMHVDMGKAFRDAVHDMLEGARGTSSPHGHVERLKETMRCTKSAVNSINVEWVVSGRIMGVNRICYTSCRA